MSGGGRPSAASPEVSAWIGASSTPTGYSNTESSLVQLDRTGTRPLSSGQVLTVALSVFCDCMGVLAPRAPVTMPGSLVLSECECECECVCVCGSVGAPFTCSVVVSVGGDMDAFLIATALTPANTPTSKQKVDAFLQRGVFVFVVACGNAFLL